MKRFALMIISAIIGGVTFTSCDADNIEVEFKNEQSAKELYEKLDAAYQLSSTNDLEKFFQEWNVSISSNTVNFIKQDKVIEVIFEVFKEFYNPLDLNKLGDWEWGNQSIL